MTDSTSAVPTDAGAVAPTALQRPNSMDAAELIATLRHNARCAEEALLSAKAEFEREDSLRKQTVSEREAAFESQIRELRERVQVLETELQSRDIKLQEVQADAERLSDRVAELSALRESLEAAHATTQAELTEALLKLKVRPVG